MDEVDVCCVCVWDLKCEYEFEEFVFYKWFGMGIVEIIYDDGWVNVLFRNGFEIFVWDFGDDHEF